MSRVTPFIKRENVWVTDTKPLYCQGWIRRRGRTYVLIFDVGKWTHGTTVVHMQYWASHITFRLQGTRSFPFFSHLQKTHYDFAAQNDVPRQQTSTNPYISSSITTYTGSPVVHTRSTYSAVQSTTMSSTYCPLTPKSAKLFQNTLLTHWKTTSKQELQTTP